MNPIGFLPHLVSDASPLGRAATMPTSCHVPISGLLVGPHLDAAQIVMKLGLFVQFAHGYAQALGLNDGVTLRVSLQGLDRKFFLSYDPSDLTQFQFPPITAMSLGAGEELDARIDLAIPNGALPAGEFIIAIDELQADLFHRVRFPSNFALRTPAVSLRYTPQAVQQHVLAALKVAVIQG